MPDTYNVKLYKNTGFNKGNIPSSPTVLAGMQYEEAPAVFKFQERGLAEIKLDKTFSEVSNVDYCVIGTDYYVVGGITMASAHTAILVLIQDPINTAGGIENIDVVGGWVNRAHTRDDTLFHNILDEPFTPTRELQIHFNADVNSLPSQNKGYYHIVGVTVSLDETNSIAEIYEGVDSASEMVSVAVPMMTPIEQPTQIAFIPDNDHVGRYFLPNTILYVAGETTQSGDTISYSDNPSVSNALTKLRSIGVDSAITCSFIIPKAYVLTMRTPPFPATTLDARRITYLALKNDVHKDTGDNLMTYGAGRSVNNKKALALYNTYKITSNTSGDSLEFEAHEITKSGDTLTSLPEFRIIRDGAPDGACYLAPVYFDGAALQYLQQAVQGQPWLNEPIALYGSSGYGVSNAGLNRAMGKAYTTANNQYMAADYTSQQSLVQNAKGRIDENFAEYGAVADVAGNILGMVAGGEATAGGIVGAAHGALDIAHIEANRGYNEQLRRLSYSQAELSKKAIADSYNWEIGDKLFANMTNTRVVSPQIICPQSPCFQGYFGNTFTITHKYLSDADVVKFDRFLTMYGYADDRPFEHADLNSRVHFNYIKTADAQVKSPYAPLYITQMIEAALNNGVRLWHEAPNTAAYSSNPMVT